MLIIVRLMNCIDCLSLHYFFGLQFCLRKLNFLTSYQVAQTFCNLLLQRIKCLKYRFKLIIYLKVNGLHNVLQSKIFIKFKFKIFKFESNLVNLRGNTLILMTEDAILKILITNHENNKYNYTLLIGNLKYILQSDSKLKPPNDSVRTWSERSESRRNPESHSTLILP